MLYPIIHTTPSTKPTNTVYRSIADPFTSSMLLPICQLCSCHWGSTRQTNVQLPQLHCFSRRPAPNTGYPPKITNQPMLFLSHSQKLHTITCVSTRSTLLSSTHPQAHKPLSKNGPCQIGCSWSLNITFLPLNPPMHKSKVSA